MTYGAGGTTRERTHATVGAHRARNAAAAGRPSDLRRRRARRNRRNGARDYVAPASAISWRCAAIRPPAPTPLTSRARRLPDHRRAGRGVKAIGDIEVSVATYPEKHPQSPNLLHDVELLKRKVDAGADRAITQFFFDNSVYFRFLDVAAAAGITIPIVPGIVPVQNFKQTASFARRAGRERAADGSPSVSRGSTRIR